VDEAHVAALAGHQRQRRGHPAAGRVAGHGHALRVEPVGRTLAHDPAGDGVSLLEGDRIVRFR